MRCHIGLEIKNEKMLTVLTVDFFVDQGATIFKLLFNV